MRRREIISTARNQVRACDAKLRFLGTHVRALVRDFGLQHFVETGTGIGESVAFVQGMDFRTIWSCDIEQTQIDRALSAFPDLRGDPRINLIAARSTELLATLPRFPRDEPILFWLDAHFPGTYHGQRKWADETDPGTRIPLEQELALIRKHRPENRDVILIDDLWFWLPGSYEWGDTLPAELRDLCPQGGIGFIEAMYADTHEIAVHREYSGWLSLTPKSLRFTPSGPPGRVQIWDKDRPDKRILFDSKLALLDADVRGFVEDYHLTRLVETGTGFGQSVVYALSLDVFRSIWSCEIDADTLERGKALFAQMADPRVRLFLGLSVTMLECLGALPTNEGVLFWLDAHFPGSHFGRGGIGDEPDERVRVPLREELETIKRLRPGCRDVIMIDDLWLFEDGDYEWGELPEDLRRSLRGERGRGFVDEIFGETHDIELHSRFGGWLSLTPKM